MILFHNLLSLEVKISQILHFFKQYPDLKLSSSEQLVNSLVIIAVAPHVHVKTAGFTKHMINTCVIYLYILPRLLTVYHMSCC